MYGIAYHRFDLDNFSTNTIHEYRPNSCIVGSASIKHPVMAPVHAPKSQRTQARALARSDECEIEEPSQPGSQSSDGNQATNLATEMQREVL